MTHRRPGLIIGAVCAAAILLVLTIVLAETGQGTATLRSTRAEPIRAPRDTSELAQRRERRVASAVGSTDDQQTVEPTLRSATVVFTGDFLIHTRVTRLAAEHAANDPGRDYDYRPFLEPIRPWIEGADWAVCHLEVNLSADGSRLSSYPAFRAPGQLAFDAAEVGYDSCTTASNHILDYGVAGVTETLGVLDDAGLHHTGAARTQAEADQQMWVEVNGLTFAHLAYSYGFNGIPLPADAPWTTNRIDQERILADARSARDAGAEYVVVSLHWGEQYRHEPTPQQAELGPILLASPDIDLVVGHHAHVVQPIELIDGEWLVYGIGNLLSNQTQLSRRDELLIEAVITEESDGGFSTALTVLPLHLDDRTLTVHPTDPENRAGERDDELLADLEASLERVTAVLATGSGYDRFDLG